MKKISLLSISALALLLIPNAHAEDDMQDQMCMASIMNVRGECKEVQFECNAFQLEEGFRKVESCDMYEPKESGASPEAVANRRFARFRTNTQQPAEAEKATVNKNQAHIGRASLIRDLLKLRNKRIDAQRSTEPVGTERQMRTEPQENANYSNYKVRQRAAYNEETGKADDGLTAQERLQKRREERGSYRPAIQSSNYRIERTGSLSNTSFYLESEDRRNRDTLGEEKPWQTISGKNYEIRKRLQAIREAKKAAMPEYQGRYRGSSNGEFTEPLDELQ